MTLKRSVIDVILILSAFMMPWWITALAACIALFYFESFYEIVVLGLIIDSLYNAAVPRVHHIQFVMTLGAIGIFFISVYIKERLRFYH